MRIFHELVVEEVVCDQLYHRSEPHWMLMLGAFESTRITVVADRVSGTSPTIYVGAQHSPDATWKAAFLADAIASGSIPPGQKTMVTGTLGDLSTPGSYATELLYKLTDSPGTPKARIRIWVTGRGRV